MIKDIFEKIQTTLDTLLAPLNIYSYWNRAKGINEDVKEYVVYSIPDTPTGLYADDKPLTRNIGITVSYYFDETYLETSEGRNKVQERAENILRTMEAEGFTSSTGIMWLGDIDDVSKETAVMDFNYMYTEGI